MSFAAILAACLAPGQALAWWSKDWPFRQQINVDTTRRGVALHGDLRDVPIIVRLHTGNFAFSAVRPDGGDLRFVAGDDKTPLPFAIQEFDKTNELAILRVMTPLVAPNQRTIIWMYYGNAKASPAAEPAAVQDKQTVLAYDFEHLQGPPKDRSAFANNASESTATPTPAGAVGEGVAFSGASRIAAPASPSLQFSPDAGVTVTAWIRQESPRDALIFAIGEKTKHALSLSVVKGALVARVQDEHGVVTATAATGPVKLDGWRHVAVTLGAASLAIFVDGEQQITMQAPAQALPLSGGLSLGAWEVAEPGFIGAMDEVEVARVARSADWIRMAALGQGPDGRLVSVGAAEEKSRFSAYISLLVTIAREITTDGWVVIGLIGLLGFVCAEVGISKSLSLVRMDRANGRFLATRDNLDAGAGNADEDVGLEANSPLYRVQRAALAVLRRDRESASGDAVESWSAEKSDIVRSAIGRALVAEAALLNKSMVLMTLSISGAPFLGLLGTVMGVMITFASIAEAGDVDVNTIAPGISAALAATVSGLIVAIPALFYYNILSSQIRQRLNALEVYGEDLQSRIAYAASRRGKDAV